MVVASTWEHLRSTQHVKALKPRKEKFFFSPQKNRNKLQWFTLVMPVSCLCRSVRVLCTRTSRPLGQSRAHPAAPLIPQYKKCLSCFERHECEAVWSSEMWEAVCSEACVSFWGTRSGLGRVVELQTFMFTRGLCHLTGDGKNKTMKQMDKNCKICLVFCLKNIQFDTLS